jgi:hypothetical protein
LRSLACDIVQQHQQLADNTQLLDRQLLLHKDPTSPDHQINSEDSQHAKNHLWAELDHTLLILVDLTG